MFYVKRLVSTLMIALLLGSALLLAQPAPAQATNYNDISSHWARDAIARWESLGALVDFGGSSFRPDASITRVEFFSLLVHALGATEMADISQFTDVSEDAWYYEVVAKATQMRIANGVSESTMKPLDNIIRQDAATMVARAMGLAGENANYLYRYNDRDSISNYASNFVSAVTEYDYMRGSHGNFNPRSYLSRAEAVKIIDNLFTHYYRSEVGFDSFTLDGNVMSLRTDSVFNNLTINGDLILTDGVGEGSATLNNCVIRGRLLIRGGGSNSIVLNNTSVSGGITVISPSSIPRIVSNGTSTVPQLNAYSSFILSGTGVHEATIMDDAFANSKATLEGVMLDTMYAGGVGNDVDMREGRITNLHVGGAADNASCTLAQGTLVDYFSTVAPYTTVSGTGTIRDAFINAPGASFAMMPGAYTVGINLSATIAGQTATGKVVTTVNNVVRDTASRAVTQDSSRTGGEGIRVDSAQGRSSNTVLVSQKPYTKVELDDVSGRLGYYIGFFIPVPEGRGSSSIDMLNYVNSDGGLVTMENVSLTRKGGVDGLEFHIPVTRPGAELRGQLIETMYIQWDSQNTENLQFHSGRLDLETLTGSQESRLLEQYEDQRFRGYDGSRYTGEEALQRLLASDNALGLDVKGFGSFTDEDQLALAERLLELSESFTSKETVQDMINTVITGKAAVYAVNNGVTVAQMRTAFENTAFAAELNIEVTDTSLYGLLSNAGKQRVATVVLNGRSKDFADAAAVKTAFDKAVADVRNLEHTFLVTLNATRTAENALKLVETKAHAELLGFFPDEEPYKSYPAALKKQLGERLMDHKLYYSVDEVVRVIQDFLITAEESGAGPAITITGIKAEPTTINMLIGDEAEFNLIVTTSAGSFVNMDGIVITNSAPNIIDVDEENYIIIAKTAGSAKITASITDAETKKTYNANISVTVKVPIPATGVKLNKDYEEVGEGESKSSLIATMTPANSTDKLSWSSTDESIVSVDNNGKLTGIAPGYATVMVRTSSGQTATCLVAVISKEEGVMIIPDGATIGIGQTLDLRAVVSPITLPNRDKVVWSSSDSKIATVSPVGKLTGVDLGEVTITASYAADRSISGSITVIVSDKIQTLRLNTNKIIMVPTGIEQITPTVIPSTPDDVILWDIVGEDNIASVSKDGLVTGLNPGKVQVVAFLESDSTVSAYCDVEVLNSSLKITFPATLSLYAGDRLTTAIPVFAPSTITNKKIHWSVDKDEFLEIERVNANGSLTLYGKKAGTAILTGEPEGIDNLVISCRVTVSEIAVTKFSILPEHIYMDVGNVIYLTDPSIFSITMQPENATNKHILWTGDNSGRILIDNPPPTIADPYGPSSLEAVRTTYTKVSTMKQNPDGSFYYEDEWVDDPVVLIAKAAGAANNVREVKILVSIMPSETNQVNNIKIALERWVYPVGITNQYVTLHFNVTGRETNGDWILGLQPPNRKVSWSSVPSDVASVTDDNLLVTKKSGKANIMVVSQDGGRTDSATLVVEEHGITSMSFSNVPDVPSFGKVLQMFVGEEFDVNALISPAEGSNAPLVWIPYKWEYDAANPQGHATNTAYDGLAITNPVNYSTGHITAKEPGLYQVTVKPTNPSKIGILSINKLEQICNEMGLVFTDYLDKNGIVREGYPGYYTYYSPNEVNLNTPPKAPRVPLDPARDMYLVMPHQVDVGTNQFFVWVKSPLPESIAFTNEPPESITLDGDFSFMVPLIAQISPTNVNIISPITFEADILWSINGPLLHGATLSNIGYNPSTGVCTARITIPADAQPGNYTVTVKVTSTPEYGFKSTITDVPQQVQPSVTITATHTIVVTEPITPGFAPISATAPITQTTTTVEQPPAQATAPQVEQPATQPPAQPQATQPPAQPVINVPQQPPASQPLPSVSTAKALQVRKTATVFVGSTTVLVPFATPAAYDYAAVSWSSSKPDIATVSATGLVTGIKAGKTTITASVAGTRLKAACTVTVSAAPKIALNSISLSNSSLALEEGKSAALKATLNPTNASIKGISWFSSDVSIAKVDISGKVTGTGAGSATITAITDDGGRTASCTVTVTPKPIAVTGVTMSLTTLNLAVGGTYTLEYTIAPGNAANQEVRWMSNNARIVSVDANGNITALRKGTAIISVITSDGNKRATCKVVVK